MKKTNFRRPNKYQKHPKNLLQKTKLSFPWIILLSACGAKENEQIQAYNEILGTINTDVLRGTSGDDRIFGYAGDDQLYGYSGNDYLIPGFGQDRIYGGNGADTIYLEDMSQIVDGGEGDNTLILGGRLQTTFLDIDLQSNILRYQTDIFSKTSTVLKNISNVDASNIRNVDLKASDDVNSIKTGLGDDIIANIGRNDEIFANSGNDTLVIHEIPKLLNGGTGIDTIKLTGTTFNKLELNVSQNYISNLSTDTIGEIKDIEIFNLEEVVVTTFIGSDATEIIITGAGSDNIDSKGGLDIITAGQGADTIFLELNESGPITITDFEIGDTGDNLLISKDLFNPQSKLKLNFINTQQIGKKNLNIENEIVIFNTQVGYSDVNQLYASLNSSNGIALENTNSQKVDFIGLWYNNQNDWTQVSLISKSDPLSNIFDETINLAILQNIHSTDLDLFSEQNFL